MKNRSFFILNAGVREGFEGGVFSCTLEKSPLKLPLMRYAKILHDACVFTVPFGESVKMVSRAEWLSASIPPTSYTEIIINGIEKNACEILVGRDSAPVNFVCRVQFKRAVKSTAKRIASLLPD